jgi:HAD superfamily hydrolase (TIGR01549 family)
VRNRELNKNYGDKRSLEVYNWNPKEGKSYVSNAYLKFYIANIPSNMTLEAAHLSIHISSLDASIQGYVHYCPNSSWKEFEIKWKNAPDFNKDYISSVKLNTGKEFNSFEVTEALNKAIKENHEKITFVITAEEMSNLRGFSFESKESGLKEQIPKLVITYSISKIANLPIEITKSEEKTSSPPITSIPITIQNYSTTEIITKTITEEEKPSFASSNVFFSFNYIIVIFITGLILGLISMYFAFPKFAMSKLQSETILKNLRTGFESEDHEKNYKELIIPKEPIGILLDMDGTIVDSMKELRTNFINILRNEGIEISNKIEDKVGDNLAEIMSVKSNGIAEFMLIWNVLKLIESSLLKRIKLVFVAYKKLKKVANSAPLIDGVEDAVESFKAKKNIKIAIVTTRSKRDVITRLEKTSFENYIDLIITREDVKKPKPSPEQILLAIDRLSIPPSRCIMIGDMPTDIGAAKKAGVISIGVASGIFKKQLVNVKPDFIVKSIKEVPDVLDEIIKKFNLIRNSPEKKRNMRSRKKRILAKISDKF